MILNAVTCEPLSLKNGQVTYNASEVTEHSFEFYYAGAMATFSCQDGYHLSGSDTSICQASKTWSGQTPSCIEGNKLWTPFSFFLTNLIKYKNVV